MRPVASLAMEIILGVIGIVSGAFFAVGVAMMTSAPNVRLGKAFVWASAILLGVWGLAWCYMTDADNWVRVVVGLLVGAFVFIAAPATIRRMAPAKGGDMKRTNKGQTIIDQSVTSHGQTGGITAHTINVGPTKLRFDSSIGEQIIHRLPAGKPIKLHSVGPPGDQVVANEYQAFLQSRGFKVTRNVSMSMVPAPEHKISIGDDGTHVTLTIVPSAN